MPVEIERKFLVEDVTFLEALDPHAAPMRQGYLTPAGPGPSVRVRIAGDEAWLTIKGPSSADGLVRSEFEYPLAVGEAHELLALCVGGLVEKTRYTLEVDGVEWVVDRFEGANAGLALAEVELDDADEAVTLPAWVGQEVTGDARYYNSALARAPIASW